MTIPAPHIDPIKPVLFTGPNMLPAPSPIMTAPTTVPTTRAVIAHLDLVLKNSLDSKVSPLEASAVTLRVSIEVILGCLRSTLQIVTANFINQYAESAVTIPLHIDAEK